MKTCNNEFTYDYMMPTLPSHEYTEQTAPWGATSLDIKQQVELQAPKSHLSELNTAYIYLKIDSAWGGLGQVSNSNLE